MKMIVVVALALVAVAAAAPPNNIEVIPIVRSSSVQSPEGGYNFQFETGDGIERDETGELKQVLDEENQPRNVVVVRGEFSYTNNDGKEIKVQYEADENGFRANGDSIPKLPSRR